MDNVLGIINLINEKRYLKELTSYREFAAVPFAGRYRLIDFTLSNFIHAQISQVAVFTKDNTRSIMDHLGSGKEWDLDRRSGGLFILPPVHPDVQIKGDLQEFYNHLEFFERTSADTVIISPGHHVSKIDFNEILEEHKRNNADITVVYKDYDGEPVQKLVYHTCSVDFEDNILDLELFTSPQSGDHVCLETFVIDKAILIDLIKKCVENDEFDLLKDAVKANLNKLCVKGYHFKGEMPFIHSLETFHQSNMEFLNPEKIRSYFYDSWDVYTKVKHEAPAKYSNTSSVSHSLIANGCDIEGTVENSIIFRGVKVKKGAYVKNSIIMQKGEIEEGAHVENVITDKQVRITKDKMLIGESQPRVVKKAETI
ncbi:glucose-1-phosphate adenylyltransferase subunit GlgD [Bacillus sp. MUM 13]|uniref:glucose-1-phosphate adenylyltransferase subunit GlgD n=1 Tax=Bacillus sp. MUM 13 TaxID=1678001 RepID=UPI0008F5DA24|nr:glucose-1-phosphate adenylyltransferase subunit GlgD [Bacillus sp. MUM 13]OIK12691.1 glucose-1-phosphate adenylyltransferase subunit GlgD [Bacillus sp. MUM 13]